MKDFIKRIFNLEGLNLVLFLTISVFSFTLYFRHHQPVRTSLIPGILFAGIFCAYLYNIKQRHKDD